MTGNSCFYQPECWHDFFETVDLQPLAKMSILMLQTPVKVFFAVAGNNLENNDTSAISDTKEQGASQKNVDQRKRPSLRQTHSWWESIQQLLVWMLRSQELCHCVKSNTPISWTFGDHSVVSTKLDLRYGLLPVKANWKPLAEEHRLQLNIIEDKYSKISAKSKPQDPFLRQDECVQSSAEHATWNVRKALLTHLSPADTTNCQNDGVTEESVTARVKGQVVSALHTRRTLAEASGPQKVTQELNLQQWSAVPLQQPSRCWIPSYWLVLHPQDPVSADHSNPTPQGPSHPSNYSYYYYKHPWKTGFSVTSLVVGLKCQVKLWSIFNMAFRGVT